MSGILSAFGPSAAKAVVASQLDAGQSIDLWLILKALGGALLGHQAVYWKANG